MKKESVVAAVLFAGLLGTPASAQSTAGAWRDLPDRFRIDTGYFHVSGNTVLHYNGLGTGGEVAFEKDLAIPRDANTFWVDATWRLGRRHQVEVGFTRLSRDRADQTLTRDLQWGGRTYNAGLTASSSTGAAILGGYYRFALVRNDRFEIGPTVGIGHLWLDARIRATGSGARPGGTTGDRTLDQSASIGNITGAIGGYATAWPLKRLAMRADYLYIKVSPGHSEASVTDWRIGADYYFVRHVGLGVQYKYNQYRYDRSIVIFDLGGDITYKGGQVFVSFLF